MAEKYPLKICQHCPAKDEIEANLHCKQCQLDFCLRCVAGHQKIPSCKSHEYVSCDYQPEDPVSSPDVETEDPDEKKDDTKKLIALFEQRVKKDINNQQTSKSHRLSRSNVSKIIASATTLENMIGNLKLSEGSQSYAPWKVRYISSPIMDILDKMELVKTSEEMPNIQSRLSLVNNRFWIQYRVKGSYRIAIYDLDFNKVQEVKQGPVQWIHTVDQINSTEVMVSSPMALHLYTTEGEYLYKVMVGSFTGVSTDGNRVAAAECWNNQIIFLSKKDDKWQQESNFVVDYKTSSDKTIHLVGSDIFVCYKSEHFLEKYNYGGNLLQEYGTGKRGKELGQFNYPFIAGSDINHSLVVCDSSNDRFQILSLHGKWQEKLPGIGNIYDLLVVGNTVYVLHGTKISKYTI